MTRKSTLLDEPDILVKRGIYKDRDALMTDAMQSLLRSKPELRRELAIELYAIESISLSRAAEISGVDIESFKELLREAGVARTVTPIGDRVQDEVEQLNRLTESDKRNENLR